MKHQVTIKDVAREAGVSVATVSYVINNRTDMRISDATRKKVLQIINLLGYTPNQSAQALATSQKRMVALYMSPEASVLKKAEQMYFLDFLSSFLHEKNYGLIYLSDAFTEKYDHADAIIGYDISSDYFLRIGDSNFVPLLAMDCFIPNQFLFFQINSDYDKMAQAAQKQFGGNDYTFLALDSTNAEKKALWESVFPSVSCVSEPSELEAFLHRRILVTDHTLKALLEPHMDAPELLCYVPSVSAGKAEALFSCMEYALERKEGAQHNVLV